MIVTGIGITATHVEEPTSEENLGVLSNLQSVESAPPVSVPKNQRQQRPVFNASGKPPIQAASLLMIGSAIFCGVLFLACLIIIPVLLFVVNLPFLSAGVIVSVVLMFHSFLGAYLSIHLWGNVTQMSTPRFDSSFLLNPKV